MTDQETAELRYIGDKMQSQASRVLAWLEPKAVDGYTPYEVSMAMVELKESIEDWTHARIGYATSNPTERTEDGDN
jgi:hypothetical protein